MAVKLHITSAGVRLQRAITGRLHGRIGEVDIVVTDWGKGALPWMVSRREAKLVCLSRATTLKDALEQAKQALATEGAAA